ncbi:hypothetical protein GCM10018952_26050 [Streptosporangium vulgare]
MGIGYLLDTNVVSEARKRNGSLRVKDWIAAAHGPTLYLSSLTVGEIRCGVELRRRRDPRPGDSAGTLAARSSAAVR